MLSRERPKKKGGSIDVQPLPFVTKYRSKFSQLGLLFRDCTRFVPVCRGSRSHALRKSASNCSRRERTQGL